MTKSSYSTQYMVVHLASDIWSDQGSDVDLKTKYQDFPYNIMMHGHNHVYPPLSKSELKGLADFIYQFLRENNDKN